MEKLYLEDKFEELNPQYGSNYMHQIFNILEANDLCFTISKIEDALNLDKEKTLSLLENINLIIKKLYKNPGYNFKIDSSVSKKTLQSYNSGLNKYISFLRDIAPQTSNRNKWLNKYGNEDKTIYALAHQVDGTDSLLHLLNVSDYFDFARQVLSESYFFDPTDVGERFECLLHKYVNNEKMDARWTEIYLKKNPGKTKKEIKELSETTNDIVYEVECKTIPVCIDKDGNYAVRELIKDKTGHKVSSGKDSTFQFYKISHIWGNAYDPRYFTNLWNLVLVPAWANDLLDKTDSHDPLTITFQNVIKYVCFKHYKMARLNWSGIGLNKPNISKELISNYSGKKIAFKVFKSIGNDELKFAKVSKKSITIS